MIVCRPKLYGILDTTSYKMLLGFCLLAVTPVGAAELGPADIETSNWTPASAYSQPKTDTAEKPKDQAAESAPAIASPSLQNNAPKSEPSTALAASNESRQPANHEAAPVMAAPTRPLVMPVMPGINKGYNVRADSTEENAHDSIAVSAKAGPATPQAENWHQPHQSPSINSDNETEIPVRMSFLPNRRITPLPSTMRGSQDRVGMLQAEMSRPAAAEAPKALPEAVQTPTQQAACAAVDRYKQKQLKAIQSDRQTLAALQAAIAQLGLQKQLSFLTDPNAGAATPRASNATPLPTNTASAHSDAPVKHEN